LDEEEEAEAVPTVEGEQSKLSGNERATGRRRLETIGSGTSPGSGCSVERAMGPATDGREPLEKGEQGQVDPQFTILVLPALSDDLRPLLSGRTLI
jgi:hypothetical protein